jgi:hypothetical protein
MSDSQSANSPTDPLPSTQGIVVKVLKKPIVWLLGIVVGILATSLTGILTKQLNLILEGISVAACNLSRASPSAAEEKRFTVLISPFAGDEQNKVTTLVWRAFLQDTNIFRTIQICESFDIASNPDQDRAKQEFQSRSASIIKGYNADVLVLGAVNPGAGFIQCLDRQRAWRLWLRP